MRRLADKQRIIGVPCRIIRRAQIVAANHVAGGVDVITQSGQVLVDAMTRAAMVPYMITQRIISRRERAANRQEGIAQAKKNGKYTGRKPIKVDENVLHQVAVELDEGLITVKDAMKRVKLNSRSTFYRKLRGTKLQR